MGKPDPEVRRQALAVLAVFAFTLAWTALYHLVLLEGADLEIRPLYRPDMNGKIWLSLLGALAVSALFVAGYRLSARRGTLAEGLVYGLGFALLAGLLVDLNQYVLYPIPAALAAKWFLGGVVEFAVGGVLVGLICPVRRV
jgi:hypothetical protein